MKQYDYSETYNSHTITVKATTSTGVTQQGDQTVTTDTLAFWLDGALQFADSSVTEATLAERFTFGVQKLKDQIDSLDDTDILLIGLGFTLDDTVDTPTGFMANSDETTIGTVYLNFDVVPPVEQYTIDKATMADYSDAYTILQGDFDSPQMVTGLTSGHYYFRMKAHIDGMTDSDYAYADVEVP